MLGGEIDIVEELLLEGRIHAAINGAVTHAIDLRLAMAQGRFH
jgi:hypothetical protein